MSCPLGLRQRYERLRDLWQKVVALDDVAQTQNQKLQKQQRKQQ